MRIKLIFDRWASRFDRESKEFIQAPEELYHTNFHAGTTYQGEIHLSTIDYWDLREAAKEGFFPVFEVREIQPKEGEQ